MYQYDGGFDDYYVEPQYAHEEGGEVEETVVMTGDVDTATPGTYKIGSPYKIDGVWYYPHEDYDYSEIGIASWYGDPFHGGPTSNGEIFNKHGLSAAHRTLPLPSVVKVTNMENGKSVILRVNDRGPFARDRILDVSERAAEILDFKQKGSTQVKVEIMEEESKRLKELAMAGSIPPVEAVALSETEVSGGAPALLLEEDVTDVSSGDLLEDEMNIAPPSQNSDDYTGGAGDYYVQIAAFSARTNAENLRDKVSSIGPSVVKSAYVNGVNMYRVRLGGFSSEAKARNYLSKVKDAGYYNARVVKETAGADKWIK
jgi:rare lipoprotein A